MDKLSAFGSRLGSTQGTVLVSSCERPTTLNDSENSLSPLGHFTEHLEGVFEKLPSENNLDHKFFTLSIRWLRSTPGITLQQSHRHLKEN
jgi:hypothetical protein